MAINSTLLLATETLPTPPTVGASSSFQLSGQYVNGITVMSASMSTRNGTLMAVSSEGEQYGGYCLQIPYTIGGSSHSTARATQGFRPLYCPAALGSQLALAGALARS